MNNITPTRVGLILFSTLALALNGCGESGSTDDHAHGADTHEHADGSTHADHAQDTHTHADGSTHADHADDSHMGEEDHAHDEIALEPATIGDMTVELAQGHGAIKAGQESHLVVKLPYSDNGATIVRAWIGGEDRTMSFVGKGEYAPSHDDYDIHAMAPDPLPAGAMWWIEIEKPDGAKVVGSAEPIRD